MKNALTIYHKRLIMKQISVIIALILLTSCGAMSGVLKNPAAMELLSDGEQLLEKETKPQKKKLDQTPMMIIACSGILIIIIFTIFKMKNEKAKIS